MKNKLITGSFCAAGILLLILDTQTAMSGASEGLMLCIRTVVPSLFPFFILSCLLTSVLTGIKWKALYPLSNLCGIPHGAQSLFLVGLLGGYPVGAQAVAQAYSSGQLSRTDARRMLGFCSNAGPAFLFGIVAGKFTRWWAPWLLWGIHILSALITGIILPRSGVRQVSDVKPVRAKTLPQALEASVKTASLVCGWVILFRIMAAFLDRWILWLFPVELQVGILGLLELTNGCCELEYIQNEGLRFLCASGILGFGGLCVAMQTFSVADKTGSGWYLPGKILQALLSMLLSSVCVWFFYTPESLPQVFPVFPAASALMLGICMILLRKREKRSSNPAIIGV